MDPDLIAALRAGWPIVHLVTVTLPDHTIRWTDGGFVRWGGELYKARDPIYGVIDEIGDIVDGISDDASPTEIVVIPPDLSSLAALASADAQGGWVTIHLAATNPITGQLAGEPYQLHVGELDQPRLRTGRMRALEYDVITGEARGLRPNEEQRQSDAFRQMIWPGEKGDEYATDGTKRVYWRADEPRNAIGVLAGRGSDDDDDAIEFNYEPNAALAFPFGHVGIGATIRYRVGYGPTNRWQTIIGTFGASGPIKDLISVSFDDELTTFGAFDRATSGSHVGEMWFKWLPGAQPSPALTSPTGPNAHTSQMPGWTTDHKLSGRPAFAWTGKENSKEEEYRGGIPKPVLTVEGLFGFDPRDPACELDDPSSWPWIEEGCIAALNWSIGRWEGSNGASPARYGVPYQSFPVGGIAAPFSTIDVDAFVNAADIADANGWTMAGVAFSDQDKNDVLEDMLAASGAVRARRCGMISCVSFGAPTPSLMTVTQKDTAGAIDITLAPSRLDRNNTGIPSFLSEENRWEITPVVGTVSNPDWVAADGGAQTEGYEYRYVTDPDQAAQLNYLEIANEREGIIGTGPFKPWMMAIEPGQAFDWDEPEYLLVGVKVRLRKRKWSPRNCTVRLDFRQETDAKYADAFEQTGTAPPPSAAETPPPKPARPVETPTYRASPDGTSTVIFTTTADEDSITVTPHKAYMADGEVFDLPAVTLTGLDSLTVYGVFWKDGVGYEVEQAPALGHTLDGGWVIVGWQSTADSEGAFPVRPVAPGGSGGTGSIPLYDDPI